MTTRIEKDIYVARSDMPEMEAYFSLVAELWESRAITNAGKLHEQLEQELQQYLKTPDFLLFANGHLALNVALRALDLKGEVITTPFTFLSTTNAIMENGLTPVFCDIRSDTYNIDETKIEALINENTCAILPVHVYGTPCSCTQIEKIAAKFGLPVIYDAAHAFGVEVDGKGIASFGDISMFSFHATKVFHTVEGGGLAFHNESLQRKLISLKNFGLTDPIQADYIGMNAKMSEFHAAMGLLNLQTIDKNLDARKSITERYRHNLSGLPSLKLSLEPTAGVKSNYAYFPVLIEPRAGISRDGLFDYLEKHRIHSRKYFYPLISDLRSYKELGFDSSNTPIAKVIAEKVLALPIYASLEHGMVDIISEHIIEYMVK